MKSLLVSFTLLFSIPAFSIDTVQNLDVDQYTGLWHQLGAIPQNFAKDCIRNTTAEYKKLEDGTIEVLNSCEEADGTLSVAEGRARVNPDFNSTSKLEVTFVKLLGKWMFNFGGDYWVLDLEKNYEWSLVGHPELNGLYILSRTQQLPNETLKQMRETIEKIGYDSCDVVMSATPEGVFKGTERFCDLNL